ncbi:TolC family protein [Hymenobacter sp. B81]|uniref:TolC family protein n=1 Tax=Hymenobacter sp. B81 TaxID=3344878 RepID=UPI0037DC280F
MRRIFWLGFLLVLQSGLARAAADTLRLRLPEAEQRFLERNLSLLAQRYQVSAAEAQILQARLWDNPTVFLEQNAYNPHTGRVLDVTASGNSIVQVQQLFALAGRRRAAADVARQQTLVEQFTFEDLLRTLRYQLRATFYGLYYQQRTLQLYDEEIGSLQRTVEQFQQQHAKGNLALKEVIRLNAFLFQLENERQGLRAELAAAQADLRVLLGDEAAPVYQPEVSEAALRTLSLGSYTAAQLADSAVVRRADLKAQQAQVEQQAQNIRLQRALATPDLALGYSFDRAGNYIQNYNAVTLGVALPLFNRNQGNIRTARAQAQGSQAQFEQQRLLVRSEVAQAYEVASQADRLYQRTDRDTEALERLRAGIEQSFARRNLTVVEFLDFYESYKNNVVQLNQLRATRVRAFEQLNLAVGQPLFQAE